MKALVYDTYGKPYLTRLGGLRKPRYRILGADNSGRVVSVGSSVKKFQIGDELFGDLSACGWGEGTSWGRPDIARYRSEVSVKGCCPGFFLFWRRPRERESYLKHEKLVAR